MVKPRRHWFRWVSFHLPGSVFPKGHPCVHRPLLPSFLGGPPFGSGHSCANRSVRSVGPSVRGAWRRNHFPRNSTELGVGVSGVSGSDGDGTGHQTGLMGPDSSARSASPQAALPRLPRENRSPFALSEWMVHKKAEPFACSKRGTSLELQKQSRWPKFGQGSTQNIGLAYLDLPKSVFCVSFCGGDFPESWHFGCIATNWRRRFPDTTAFFFPRYNSVFAEPFSMASVPKALFDGND